MQRLRKRTPELPAFRRQHPIGPYVADFYCSAARLVLEINGASHGEELQRARDDTRDLYMQRLVYRILRITAANVMARADETAEEIVHAALGLIREDTEGGLAPPPSRARKSARHLPSKGAGEE